MCLLNWVLSANLVPQHQYDIFVSWTVTTWQVQLISWWKPVHNGRKCASCKNIISMWKLHIDCFQHCHFVMVPLNMTYLHCLQHSLFEHLFNLYCQNPFKNCIFIYKRTINYVYILFVLRPIIGVFVDCMHTCIFKCFNNLSIGKVVYCYEIHSLFSWPMLTMWNDVCFYVKAFARIFYYWPIIFLLFKTRKFCQEKQ